MSACAIHSEAVEPLIAAGARVNDADVSGSTPLMYAVSTLQPGETARTVQILLKHGANPRMRDKKGCTALMRAQRW